MLHVYKDASGSQLLRFVVLVVTKEDEAADADPGSGLLSGYGSRTELGQPVPLISTPNVSITFFICLRLQITNFMIHSF